MWIKKDYFMLLVLVILILKLNCATERLPLVSPSHPEAWQNQTAENFHGKKVLAVGSVPCQSCHGTAYQGGSSQVSCYRCHASYPHQPAWTFFNTPENHAHFLKTTDQALLQCQSCHGTDLRGGRSGVSCYRCHRENLANF